jgi:hypothetical protein
MEADPEPETRPKKRLTRLQRWVARKLKRPPERVEVAEVSIADIEEFKAVDVSELGFEGPKTDTARRIVESYSWLGDSAIRALTSMQFPLMIEEALGTGLVGIAFEVKYGTRTYVLKISVEMSWVPFSPREGMIGAYLFAPRLPASIQQKMAVPEFRLPGIKNDADPYLHVVDYYGMLVTRMKDAERTFKAISDERHPDAILEFLKEIKLQRLLADDAIVLFQIIEHFEDGNLLQWVDTQLWDVDWATKRETALDAVQTTIHYLDVAFYQIASTIDRMGEGDVQFHHGDPHAGNIFVRSVDRGTAQFVYLRDRKNGVRDYFNGNHPSNPKIVGDDPDDVPFFALGDLGTSVVETFGTAGLAFVPHRANNLHTLAMGILEALIRSEKVNPIAVPTHVVEATLVRNGEAALEMIALHSKAFYLLTRFAESLVRFLVQEGPEAELVFEENVAEAYFEINSLFKRLVSLWREKGRLWPELFGNPKYTAASVVADREYFKNIVERWVDPRPFQEMLDLRKRLAPPPPLPGEKKKEKKQITMFDVLAASRFTKNTVWSVVEDIEDRQLAMLRNGDAAPRGLEVVPPTKIEEFANEKGLERPMFVEGTEEFWRMQPAQARIAARREEDEDEDGEVLFPD